MKDAHFPAPPPRLLDLVYQRGEFAPQTRRAARGAPAPAIGTAAKASRAGDAGDKAIRAYAQAALDRARDDVATCAPGRRGHTLNAAAFGMGPFVALGALSEREVFAALQDAADACGLTATDGAAERDAKIRRGLTDNAGATGELSRKFQEMRDDAARRRARSSHHASTSRSGAQHARPPLDTQSPPIPPHAAEPPARHEDLRHDADGAAVDGAGDADEGAPGAPSDPSAAAGGDAGPVRPLGHNGGVYFYLSTSGEIRRIRDQDHKRLQILSLYDGDDAWLIEHCPAYTREGEVRPGAWSHEAAAKLLIRLAAAEGIFDPNTPARGPGVWKTKTGQIVVHVGNAIARLDAEACHSLAEPGGRLVWEVPGQVIDEGLYAATARCQRPAKRPAGREAGARILAGLRRWHYSSPLSADVILGFMGAALLGGVPDWRVHLLIKAQGGSGKTWLMNFFEAAFGGMGAYGNDVTEAGLRQALTGETRVLLVDEAEGDEGPDGKVEGVIRLIRLMSTGAGASVMRGSSGGKGQSFTLTGCAVMGAVVPPVLKPQDRSRICVIDLMRPPSGAGAALAADHVAAATQEARRLAPALRTRAIAGWPRFADTFRLYRAGIISGGISSRNADTLATILAGRDLLLHDTIPDSDSVQEDLARFAPIMAQAEEAEDEGEGQQCLNHLYSSSLDRWSQGERSTVGEMIMERRNDLLARIGLHVLALDKGGGVLVAHHNVGLSRVFEGSKWAKGRWVTALRYLDGASAWPAPRRFAGALSRCVWLGMELMPKQDEG